MAVDFGKLGGTNAADKVISPRDIFRALPSKNAKFQYLRDVQAEVLDGWFKRKEEKDLLLKMNTGSGKTALALLILKSCLNEGKGPSVYVAADNYLVTQVMEEAKLLGIDTTDDPRNPDYLSGRAICVINIYKLVNGKSVFGVGDEGIKIPIGSILVDDVHACLFTTEGQFTLSIDLAKPAYSQLLALFIESLRQQSQMAALEIECGDPSRNMLVPYWSWISKQKEVAKILHSFKDDTDIQFVWPLIKNHLALCRCVFNGTGIEISTRSLPIDSINSFGSAKRRIFMTATLPDDSALITDFDADPNCILRPITPKNANDIGDRMILIPQELNPSITDVDIKNLVVKLSKKHNVVVIVPSNTRAGFWDDVAQLKLTTPTLPQGIEKLKKEHVGIAVLINRYDGIDLPDNACRVMVIDGLPDVRRKIDRIEQNMLEDSEALLIPQIQRTEQGMGRAIRSTEDYCVILLMGASLVGRLHTVSAKAKFSAATQAQLELSEKLAMQIRGRNINDMEIIIDYCLNRNADWLSASKGALVDLKYDIQGNIDQIVLARRTAFDKARIEVGWIKRTPKSSKINRRRCQYERGPARKVYP